jgi:hypothetical protein
MTHAEIRTTIAWALREMDRADQRLDQSETRKHSKRCQDAQRRQLSRIS